MPSRPTLQQQAERHQMNLTETLDSGGWPGTVHQEPWESQLGLPMFLLVASTGHPDCGHFRCTVFILALGSAAANSERRYLLSLDAMAGGPTTRPGLPMRSLANALSEQSTRAGVDATILDPEPTTTQACPRRRLCCCERQEMAAFNARMSRWGTGPDIRWLNSAKARPLIGGMPRLSRLTPGQRVASKVGGLNCGPRQ